MEDQLITYYTAVIAREMGFDVPCVNYWVHHHHNEKMRITQGSDYDSDLDIEFDWNNNTEDSKMILAPYPNKYHKSQASAPTQSLLQRWLREEHSIHITIEYRGKYFGNVWRVSKSTIRIEEHDSYEDALETGLQKALKLING